MIDKSKTFLSSGRSIQSFEDGSESNTENIYRNAFRLGISLNDRDGRCQEGEFVKFNPDMALRTFIKWRMT
jgi:hypothetical protein